MVFEKVECKILCFKTQKEMELSFEFIFSKLIVLLYPPNCNEFLQHIRLSYWGRFEKCLRLYFCCLFCPWSIRAFSSGGILTGIPCHGLSYIAFESTSFSVWEFFPPFFSFPFFFLNIVFFSEYLRKEFCWLSGCFVSILIFTFFTGFSRTKLNRYFWHKI